MMIALWNGVGSLVLRLFVRDSTLTNNGGKTGLTFSSSGLVIGTIADNEASATAYTQAGSTIETISTLGTFATPTATKCRFKEVDSTNFPGMYEVQIANARWGVSGARYVVVTISGVSGATQENYLVQLPTVNLNDGTNSATPSVPNAAPGGASGLSLVGSNMGTVTSVTGNVGGNVVGSVGSVAGNVVGSVGSVATSVTVGAYSGGQDPATLVGAMTIESAAGSAPAFTFTSAMKQVLGMAAGVTSGMGGTTGTVQNPGGTKNRVVATIDTNGNRTPSAWDNS